MTGAELLSLAAFNDGLQAQAFPSFGSERMGAPVIAFCRIDDVRIRLREPIAEPDAVVVQDPTLLHHVDVFGGLGPDGYILINSTRTLEELGLSELRERHRPERLMTVPASEFARVRLGRPIPNAALLGGLTALTELTSIDALEQAIDERFGASPAAKSNRLAARDAYEHVGARREAARA